MKKVLTTFLSLIILVQVLCAANIKNKKTKAPNIIFILSDDLNWGDLGCFGQKLIKTPNIDQISSEGIRFTQAYAGNAVSAPSRSCLMQGKHSGHARVRDNSYQSYRESLKPGDFTIAALLKQAGYKTSLFGKWGLSVNDQPGLPNDMGFDEFFGYLNQQHAHTFYPEFLYHNKEKVYYPENGLHYKLENYSKPSVYDNNGICHPNAIEDPSRAKYSFDVYAEKSLEFVRQNKDNPFFLYLAYTIPHGQNIVPELGQYKDKDWLIQYKELAAMITRMDSEIGKLLALLKTLGIDENTLIFFASDNGNIAGNNRRYSEDNSTPSISEFFNSVSPTRGGKGSNYDGTYHVPAIARWTNHIKPNQVSDQIWAFWDFFPTAAELAGVKPPKDIDGISILPTLLGTGKQKQHDFLYWEFNQDQNVRKGKWFARRVNKDKFELYDLIADPQQSKNLKDAFPEVVKEIEKDMDVSHTPSDIWPSPGETEDAFKLRLKTNNVPVRPSNISLY